VRAATKSILFRLGVGGAAQRLKRAVEPRATRQDRRDADHLRVILAATLAPGSSCVDVGANVGDVLAEMVRLAPEGRHVAFEPLPALAAALAQRFPGVDVRSVALADEAGRSSYAHVVTRPGWSGLRERPMARDERVETIEVEVRRLDDELPEDLAPALIKIDVEGAELGVLRGARETLRTHRPLVVFEHGLGSADHYGTHPRDVFGLLAGLGYRVFDLEGEGPFTEAAFVETYLAARRVNFLARP
jgi:FkbM family methyltransferase